MELFLGIILITMPILFAMGLLAFMMTGPKKDQEATEVVEFTTEVINDENIAV